MYYYAWTMPALMKKFQRCCTAILLAMYQHEYMYIMSNATALVLLDCSLVQKGQAVAFAHVTNPIFSFGPYSWPPVCITDAF